MKIARTFMYFYAHISSFKSVCVCVCVCVCVKE